MLHGLCFSKTHLAFIRKLLQKKTTGDTYQEKEKKFVRTRILHKKDRDFEIGDRDGDRFFFAGNRDRKCIPILILNFWP